LYDLHGVVKDSLQDGPTHEAGKLIVCEEDHPHLKPRELIWGFLNGDGKRATFQKAHQNFWFHAVDLRSDQ